MTTVEKLVAEIRSEAAISSRPGQMDRLERIADALESEHAARVRAEEE